MYEQTRMTGHAPGKAPLPITHNSLRYAVAQLAQRAGVTDVAWRDDVPRLAGVPVFYGNPARFESIDLDAPACIVVPAVTGAWHQLLELQPGALDWVSVPEPQKTATPAPPEMLPVLMWGAGYEDGGMPFVNRAADGNVVFYADIIGAALFMLTRWEEVASPRRDEHGRFPATASVAYRHGFLDRPIIDEYGLILRHWLQVLAPAWEPEPRPFAVRLSHDIDLIRPFPGLITAGRTVGGDLIKRCDLAWAAGSAGDLIAQGVAPHRSSYFRDIFTLAELSEQYGLPSAFYFMATGPGPQEADYDVTAPPIRQAIQELDRRGHEIGLHPGYRSFKNLEKLAAEKQRLQTVWTGDLQGGRQHFLRFEAPVTWRHWESVGLAYDSTVGYADHEGFRCGTCHAYRPFDLVEDRELELLEYPLLVMDVTLRNYRNLAPQAAAQVSKVLIERCRRVGGVFTLLWHNSSLRRDWAPWRDLYVQILAELATSP